MFLTTTQLKRFSRPIDTERKKCVIKNYAIKGITDPKETREIFLKEPQYDYLFLGKHVNKSDLGIFFVSTFVEEISHQDAKE